MVWLISCLLAANAGSGAANSEPKVVVTIKPIHSIVAAVMHGGAGAPRLLIDGVGSPHTFSLKPSDAKELNTADVIFRVSEELEPYTIKIAPSLPKRVRLVTLAETPGLTTHALRASSDFEAHDHGGAGDKGHQHGHKQGHGKPASKNASRPTAGIDGHIWLDPINAKLMARQIADVLATIAPGDAARFLANAASFGERMDVLDRELEQALAPVRRKAYIVFHDAYQYLERRYELAPVGSVTVSPDIPPSAKRLSELRGKIATLKAACVFAEPQFGPKVIDTIVEGTLARRGVLDPLGVAVAAGPDHYPTLMRALANDLRACLVGSS